MQKKINIIILGFGFLGKWHVQKAVADSRTNLIGVVEANIETHKTFKKEYPKISIYESLELIEQKIDAAIIVTPTSTHFDICKNLLKRNIHIFCEKPMTAILDDAEEILDILKQRPELVFQVGHSERCHQAWDAIISYPEFTKKRSLVKLSRVAPFKGRATDVDVVSDLMIHDIDILYYLFNELPKEVSAIGFKIRTDKWDYVCAKFIYENGREVLLTVGRNNTKEERSFEMITDKGMLQVDLLNNNILIASGKEQNSKNYVQEISYEKRDHLKIEQDYFYRSILENNNIFVTAKEGRDAIYLISKTLEALDTGKVISV